MRTFPMPPDTRGSAIFSPCGGYRYVLERDWNPERPSVVWIGLNPSTADAEQDDPTVRRCCDFARRWGCGGIVMLNIFAYRATDPKALYALAADRPEIERRSAAVGPKNDRHIARVAAAGHVLIAAWGTRGALYGRVQEVIQALGRHHLRCLGITQDGHPKHPLYLRADTPLRPLPDC